MKCSIAETKKFAEDLAEKSPARLYALVGELGSGKTTFTQFFLRALGIVDSITSPTFVIIKSYPLTAQRYTRAYHIDCYRLENPRELLALGFTEIADDQNNIIIIEWAERIKELLPSRGVAWITFFHSKRPNERIITY